MTLQAQRDDDDDAGNKILFFPFYKYKSLGIF